jgi:hypothetical protein
VNVAWPLRLLEGSNLLAEVQPVCVGVAVLGVLEVVEGAESDTDTVGADGIGHGLDHLQGEAASVFYRTAILICASVDVVVEELLQKIAIGA